MLLYITELMSCYLSVNQGIFCDMVTGEERRFARQDGLPSNHIACTVEMTNIAEPCKYYVAGEVIVQNHVSTNKMGK